MTQPANDATAERGQSAEAAPAGHPLPATQRGNCTNCRFSRIDHESDGSWVDGPLLRCHRYPPVVFVIDERPLRTFPNVDEGDWCGEYQPERTRSRTQPLAGRPTVCLLDHECGPGCPPAP